ncbi:MAG TPA: hypothetical protein VNJ10_08945 [Sphingomonas sp.]|nr:hypothetical protein [Sphingomonas sp.]
MAFVSITRLRLRSLRFLPQFVVHALSTTAQIRRAAGFVGGELLPDRQLTFWTMTMWHYQADMRRYIVNGAHLKVMPKLMHWCDEASIVHWDQDARDLPSWDEADRRMRGEGRPSKVRHPTPHHADLSYRPPRTTRAAPIVAR